MVKAIIATFILCYCLFTSGLVYELTKSKPTDMHELPYSIAFSNDRTRIVGVNNQGDLDCADWITVNNPSGLPVYMDYCSTSIFIGRSMYVAFRTCQPEGAHYIYLNTWNVEEKKMVLGNYGGMREYEPLPELDNAVEIYRSGKAIVYRVDM